MKNTQTTEVAIIGAGIAGIATAYYLCKKYKRKSVVLIDSRDPMSYTSAQSGDNYRNWWPSSVMTKFSNHSIDLMEEIARESSNILQMKRRGYALATRSVNIDNLLQGIESTYIGTEGLIRVHSAVSERNYPDPHNDDWQSAVDGVDAVSDRALIAKLFSSYSTDIQHVLHIRRAGDFSSQQMGEYMLQQIKPLGGSRVRGQVLNVSSSNGYTLEVQTQAGRIELKADTLVNAAGPYVNDVAKMLDSTLPVTNIFHQKIAFEDTLCAVPRDQPFSIDLDATELDWSDEERAALNDDPELRWLTKPIDGGIHCRPEGAGSWIKLGWAYNRKESIPDYTKQLSQDPRFDPHFPEVVIRGAAKLNPKLSPYCEVIPPKLVHYGGYYTMTKENWPLIGPMAQPEAFVIGALSGFGSMGACAAGSLCADWVCGGTLPEYAYVLSPARYDNPRLINEITKLDDIGLL